MAEREGFEPSVPLLAVHAISSRAPSASSDISPVFYCQLRFELLANLAERVGFERLLKNPLQNNMGNYIVLGEKVKGETFDKFA